MLYLSLFKSLYLHFKVSFIQTSYLHIYSYLPTPKNIFIFLIYVRMNLSLFRISSCINLILLSNALFVRFLCPLQKLSFGPLAPKYLTILFSFLYYVKQFLFALKIFQFVLSLFKSFLVFIILSIYCIFMKHYLNVNMQ